MTGKPRRDDCKALHSLLDHVFDRRLDPGERVQAAARIRAHLKHIADGIERRSLEEVRDELQLKLSRLPRGGGVA